MAEGLLFLSSNRGRYAIGDPEHGPDLTTGLRVELCISGRWIPGRVEYNPDSIYVTLGAQALEEVPLMASRPRAMPGYYFVAATGEICGLCVGMNVRTR